MGIGLMASGVARILVLGTSGFFAVLLVHELGHLIAGALVRFRFGMIGVGPLGLSRSGDGFRLRWLPFSQWGPFAMAYPTTPDRIRVRVAWFIAGGPIASLALALGAAWATGDFSLRGFSGLVAALSSAIFVATAQPFAGTGIGIPSDGARLLALIVGSPNAVAAAALMALEGTTLAGTRPSSWDPALVSMAARVTSPPAYVMSALTAAIRRAADGDHPANAAELVARTRAVYPSVTRMLRADTAAELSFWLAYHGKNPAAAREFLEDAGGALGEPYRRWTAEAAVRVAADDREGARAALVRARKSLSQGLGTPSALDRERIAWLESTSEP
jgi:hypothetical protein